MHSLPIILFQLQPKRKLAMPGKHQILILVLSIILSSLVSGVSFGELVSKGTARQAAENFLFSQKSLQEEIVPEGKRFHYAKKVSAELSITYSRTIRDNDGKLLAYVHELSPEGFIITSADTRVRAILGFSFKGKFPSLDTKDNALLHLIKWDVKARLKALEENDQSTESPVQANMTGWKEHGPETYKVLHDATSLVLEWGPWLITNWHQGSHYNDKVPYKYPSEPDLGRRPVGCVATAMAQILNYWQYPKSIQFSSDDSYITDTNSINIDLDAVSYGFPTFSQLNNALSTINYNGNAEEEAFLNFAAGIKLEMNYGIKGSLAATYDVAHVIKNEFSYGSGEPKYWGSGIWSSIRPKVIENIKQGWPVQIGMRESGKLIGHSVIIDGYRESDDYFHINMGWSGTSEDTWYNIPNVLSYDVVHTVVYDISTYKGWHQYGADEKNSFRTNYAAPTISATNKWRVQCPSNYYFSDLVVGSGNKIYASCSFTGITMPPYIYVINQFGDLEKAIEIYANEKIEFVSQFDQYVFISTEYGEIYKIDTVTDTASNIFIEPNGDDIYSLKVDENGYLYANTLYNLYRLNSSGTVQWTFPAPSGTMFGSTGNVAPAIDSARDRVYVTYYDSNTKIAYFAAVDRQSGIKSSERLFESIPFAIFRIPSIASVGTIYLKIYDMLYALDPPDISGTPLWSRNMNFTNTPAIGKGGTLYVTYWQDVGGLWYNKLAALNPADGSEKYSISFQLDINTEDIFQPYIANNDVVVFTIENNGSPKTYSVYAYKDTGSELQYLWSYNAGTSGGNFAFGPGSTAYIWGMTGLADTIYAISEGDIGNPYGAGMDYLNNQSPVTPSSPSPLDCSVEQPTDLTLSWYSFDPDGHSMKFDVLLGSVDGEGAMSPIATEIATTSYSLTGLTPGVKYLWQVIATDGQSISDSPTWSFTTVNDPPSVVSVAPADGSTDVAINTAITAEFSESLDASTINTSTFILSNGVTGTVSYNPDTNIATFMPYSELAYSTTYTATITTGVQDLLGASMATDYIWSFTTGESPDTTTPSISYTSPSNGATGVSVATAITATFNEDMDSSTFSASTFTVSQSEGAIAGAISCSGATVTFTPAHDLDYSTTYTATITTGVKDLAGNNMASNHTWTFTTKAATNPGSDSSSDRTSGEGGCFIATAAYGSYLDPHVKVLRQFRDKHLLTNSPGIVFVVLYYKTSPLIADFIREHETLRITTRWMLTPMILSVEHPLVVLILFGFATAAVIYRRRKRRS